MRERRAAGDPYWSYSGELSFVPHASRALSGRGKVFKSENAVNLNRRCLLAAVCFPSLFVNACIGFIPLRARISLHNLC